MDDDKPVGKSGVHAYEVESDPRLPVGVFKPSSTLTTLSQAGDLQFFSIACPLLLGNFRAEILHDFCRGGQRQLLACAFPDPWLDIPGGINAPQQVLVTARHMLYAVDRRYVRKLEDLFLSYYMPLGDSIVNYPPGRVSIPDPLFLSRRALMQTLPPRYDLLFFGVQGDSSDVYLASPTSPEHLRASLAIAKGGDPELKFLAEKFRQQRGLSVDAVSAGTEREAAEGYRDRLAEAEATYDPADYEELDRQGFSD